MTEMQKSKDERLKDFLREIRQELDRVVQKRELMAAIVRGYVAKEIKLLMEDHSPEAMANLQLAHRVFFSPRLEEGPEDFHEAVLAFDLGFFAFSLKVYFDEVEEIAIHLWQARKDFFPNLAEALRAARLFVLYLSEGHKPRWSLYYVLKSPNHMCCVFDYSILHGNKSLGEVFGEQALTKLKEILYAYVPKGARASVPRKNPSV